MKRDDMVFLIATEIVLFDSNIDWKKAQEMGESILERIELDGMEYLNQRYEHNWED